jgi:hypothetical protein
VIKDTDGDGTFDQRREVADLKSGPGDQSVQRFDDLGNN